MDLNHARLPIPPLRHIITVLPTWEWQGACNREKPVSQRRRRLSNGRPPMRCGDRTYDGERKRTGSRRNRGAENQPMSDGQSGSTDRQVIPEELAIQIRTLAHDLSNALEIVVQTSYLLSTTELKAPASDWLRMLDGGVTKALDLNSALRTYIRDHTAK